MATLSSDAAVRVSTEAAGRFTNSYYAALNHGRKEIAEYYVPAAVLPDGKSLPTIIWNGNIVPDAISYQKLFEEQMPQSRYEVQSYDCHVLNPAYDPTGQQGNAASSKNMSLLVTISGYVKYGEPKLAEQRGFSETVVLVPNPDASKARSKHRKDWVIQSQNFRLVT